MLTNFRIGDRVEDKETHKRGCVTFVYSELELRGEFIAVLFDGRLTELATRVVRGTKLRDPAERKRLWKAWSLGNGGSALSTRPRCSSRPARQASAARSAPRRPGSC